jgi:hypothetical protein
MQRLQAFQYELMASGDQQRDMLRFAGACRFVFNKALALQKESHAAGNKFIGYVEGGEDVNDPSFPAIRTRQGSPGPLR